MTAIVFSSTAFNIPSGARYGRSLVIGTYRGSTSQYAANFSHTT
jgi:hypothetical protein